MSELKQFLFVVTIDETKVKDQAQLDDFKAKVQMQTKKGSNLNHASNIKGIQNQIESKPELTPTKANLVKLDTYGNIFVGLVALDENFVEPPPNAAGADWQNSMVQMLVDTIFHPFNNSLMWALVRLHALLGEDSTTPLLAKGEQGKGSE